MTANTHYNAGKQFAIELRESRLRKCRAILSRLPKGKLLDVGCADGSWGALLKGQGWEVHGVDVGRASVEKAKKKGVIAKVLDAEKPLPYRDSTFDVIFAGEVIEHVVDTDAFLRELHRCVKQGGYVLLTTPNLASLENRVRLLFGTYPAWLNFRIEGSGHIRLYTMPTLKRHLHERGFAIAKVTGSFASPLPQMLLDDVSCPLLGWLGTLFPSLAVGLIVLARKR